MKPDFPVHSSGGYIAAVGGMNADLAAKCFGDPIFGDSNPGTSRISAGGVCRNIAHNMALLGLDVKLITAVGEGFFAELLAESCRKAGIDLSAALAVPGMYASAYCYIANGEGEMQLAVADMEICRRLTPGVMQERLPVLRGAEVLVLDTNLPEETVRFLCTETDCPVIADPVSTAKAGKLSSVLHRLQTLKANRLEAELLSGVPIRDEGSICAAAEALLERGVGRVFLTLGEAGVLAADREEMLRIPVRKDAVKISTTGCGDAFTAALVWAQMRGLGLRESAAAGMAAAGIAMASEQTVNPDMSREKLEREMRYYRKTGQD